jgi:hypothetical protein
MSIQAHIVKITPVSVYQEEVYTQDVQVEIDKNITITLYDSTMCCKLDDIGRLKKIDVLVYVSTMEKTDKKALEIIPMLDGSGYQIPYAEVYGVIEDITMPGNNNAIWNFPYARLNIGSGSIFVFIPEKKVELYKPDEYIHLKGARLDLKAIEQV